MTKFRFACLFSILAVFVALAAPAQAQVRNQFYASPTSDTSANCSNSSPCPLAIAISNAIRNGNNYNSNIVSCIGGQGGWGSPNLSFAISIAIDCPGAVLSTYAGTAFVLNGTNAQVVTLRNLTFDGGAANAAPFIQVTGGATLIIENCKFQNLANGSAIAIQFLPSSPAAQLIIRDTVFSNNGIAPGSGGGLQVSPASGGSASVLLERVSFNFNITSLVLNGPVSAVMKNSTVSASRSNGIIVSGGATLDIDDSELVFNVGSALGVSGGSTARLSNDSIKNNQTGVGNSGGTVLSYSNNRIVANSSNGTPLATIQGGQ